jgi:hypothetical protein
MKKITLLMAICISFSAAIAQQMKSKSLPMAKLKPEMFTDTKSTINNHATPKAGGDVLYSYDFSNTDGWTFGVLQGSNNFVVGQPTTNMTNYMGDLSSWEIGSGDPMLYVDGITFLLEGTYQITDAWVATPVLDFTGINGVVMKWNQIFKKYNGDIPYLEISTDGGMTWPTSLVLWSDLTVNEYYHEVYGLDYYQINLSSYVADESNVKIRFRWFGPDIVSGQGQYGSGYGWQIDDIEIIENYDNDMIFDNTQVHMGYTNGGYFSLIPDDQILPVFYETMITNNGMAAGSDVTITANVNSDYWIEDTVIASFVSMTSDTFLIGPFYPEETIVEYFTSLSVYADAVDDVASNNELEAPSYGLSTGVFARDFEHSTGSGPSQYTDGADGDFMGVNYWLPNDVTIHSIGIYIDARTTYGKSLVGQVLDMDNNIIVETDQFDIPNNIADTGGWVIIPFLDGTGTDLDLVAGDYTIGAEFYWAAEDTLYIGVCKAPVHYWNIETVLRIGASWYYITQLPMMRLNLEGFDEDVYSEPVSVTENNSFVSNSSIYPNPAQDFANLSFDLKETSNVQVEVYDMAGKLMMNKNLGNRLVGNNTISMDVTGMESGIYFYTITSNGYRTTNKMVIAR